MARLESDPGRPAPRTPQVTLGDKHVADSNPIASEL